MYHCTRCGLEFKYTIETDGIDVCPTCGNDTDVYDGPLPGKPKRSYTVKQKNPFNMDEWKKKKQEINEYEERRLAHYHQVYKREGQKAAEEAYWNYTEENL